MLMLRDLIELPVVTDRVIWEARQVLRDLGETPKPHFLLRIKLSGTYFEQRALGPYVSVGKVRSFFVEIAQDGLTASAYFDKPLTEGVIEFGYGNEPMFRVKSPFEPDKVRVLNPRLLTEKNVVFLKRFFPEAG